MDQLMSMRVFARVVEAGTFTKAAESLDLPKGTVTKLVQRLEERLKVKLLNRTTRRVMVTPEGAAYYERTTRLLNDLDDMEATLGNAQANPSGRLRVDVGSSLASQVVVPALPGFYARYPDIQLDLGVSDRPVDLIAENVDCVLRAGDLQEQSLVARRIANIRVVTLASAGFVKRYGLPSHPRELEPGGKFPTINFFSARTGRPFPNEFQHKNGEKLEINGHYRVSVNESNAHLAAVRAGLGIGQNVLFAAAPFIASGELVEVLPEWRYPDLPLYVVYPPNRHLSAKVRAFVDWAAEVMRQRTDL
jgi:DNA-binding transcriptional LysR family regulator